MGTVRIYDENIKDWVVVNTSDASSTSVRSEKLLPEGVSTSNVEEVLMNMKDDISLLKSNVSWLAKHGGGGSGGGSGGSFLSAEIMVNDLPTGSSIILKDSLAIKVQSNQSNALWDIYVTSSGKTIKNANRVKQLTIDKEDIANTGIDKTFQIAIVATNPETLTQIYWNGTIYISSVELITPPAVTGTFTDYQNGVIQSSIQYKIGVTGSYTLIVNSEKIDAYALSQTSGTITFVLDQILDLQVGDNELKVQLIKTDDENIRSDEYTYKVSLFADTPVITCFNFSSNIDSPTNFVITGNSIPVVDYAVYFEKGSYKVIIGKNKVTVDDLRNAPNYNGYNSIYQESFILGDVEVDAIIPFYINILDLNSFKIYTKTFYLKAKESDVKLLKHTKSPVFDFISFNGKINNGIWTDPNNNTITIKNINHYSSEITPDKKLRFQNASYGVLELAKGSNGNSLPFFNQNSINNNSCAFTLSLCYKADFHPDDDRTILQFGTLFGKESNYTPSSGIVIKAHNLYVGNQSMDLEDQELTHITITYQTNQEGSGNVFIYIDGVVEAVYNLSKSDILSTVSQIYLAAQLYDTPMFFTDVDIYRVTLYNECLSPYEILLDKLNTETYVYHNNGNLESKYITEGLKKNFLAVDSDNKISSYLWDTTQGFDNNNTQFHDNFYLDELIVNEGTGVKISNNIQNYHIPIPIMLIDVSSSSSWEWEDFITPKAPLPKLEKVPFQYYDQSQNNSSVISGNLDISLQGTSTLADYIKNLNISFPGSVFIPKPTWFPETTYTLKADIVDSSHSLNTSIGKFVNEELGFKYKENGELENTTSWYPFSKTVQSTFEAQKSKESSAIQKYFPKATLKHGIEGFPVFLILRFYNENPKVKIIKSLGIYQFILGRDAARNLGYEIIKGVNGIDVGEITYPFYKPNVQLEVSYNKGYWIEMGENNSFPDDLGFQELNSGTFTNKKFTGAFWQNSPEYYNTIAEVKYDNFGVDSIKSPGNIKPFMDFVQNIMQLPITNRRYSSNASKTLQRNTFENIKYPKYEYVNTGTTKEWQLVDLEGNRVLSSGEELEGIITNLNIDSYAKYFVLAMFLGLIDNFQKNMPIKLFQREGSADFEPPLLGIYDTDTGCGGTNEGSIKVSEDVWVCHLNNTEDLQLCETSKSSDDQMVHTVIGNSNKLLYIDSDALNYARYGGSDKSGSIFTHQWNSFLKHFSINKLTELSDIFIDKYFIPQTEGCGELLFNLTYFCKYISKYGEKGSESNQIGKLHGRRIKQIKKWLRNRVKFLDSMFCAMGIPFSGEAQPIPPKTININSGSIPEFSVKTNYPIVINTDNQGTSGRFVFCDKNKDTSIYWGATDNTSQVVSHTISYSDSIQKLGKENCKLKDIYYQKLAGGLLPYLTDFDVSYCTMIDNMSKDNWDYFKLNEYSELRNIDCSYTAKSNLTNFNFTLDLTSGFEKLQNVNLFQSCVTSISLPSNPNIPLLSLNIKGSQLKQLNLESQSLIEELDLSGCNKLTSIDITNCSKLKRLELDNTQVSLTKVVIASDAFEEFVCKNNNNVSEITIQSINLKSIIINGCKNLKSLTISADALETLNLSDCTNLTTLNLTGIFDELSTKILYLKNTALENVQYNSSVSDLNIMDLTKFTALEDFDIGGNSKVKQIQFTNIETNPVPINHTFAACSNLERVYGHLNIKCSGTFTECKKFSIHGTKDIKYNNKDVIDGNGRYLHPTEIGVTTSNGKIVFQEDPKCTNLSFETEDATESFAYTNCSLFDVYYVFYNLGNLKIFDATFAYLQKSKFNWSNEVDNSPHVKLFTNGEQITNLHECFRNSVDVCKLISPTHSGEIITKDDGLFSPLVNCTNFGLMFYGGKYFTDRFIFRRKTQENQENYVATDLSYFYPNILSDNIKSLEFPGTNINIKINSAGNFGGFFKNLPNLTNIHAFGDGVIFINYTATDNSDGLRIPSGVKGKDFTEFGVKAVLRTQYATGEMKLDTLFADPSVVQCILNSFIVQKSWDYNATLKINDGLFSKFTSLKRVGYLGSGDNSGKLFLSSFNGPGLSKVIDQVGFPYNILEPCKDTIVEFRGFFQDTTFVNTPSEAIELPNTLFYNTTKIQQIGALFRNFGNEYKLKSGGFSNCPNLSEVAYMFSSDTTKSNLTGFIPCKLFYHGTKTIPVGGDYVNIDFDPYKKDENGDNLIDVYLESNPKETVKEYEIQIPRNNITNISGCFQGCNCSYYRNEEPTIESNPDYHPGNYKYINGVWTPVTINMREKICFWEYDGNRDHFPKGDYEDLDDPHKEDEEINVKVFSDSDPVGTQHFMCPPDLLRYCRENANITYLFEDSGHTSNSNIQHAGRGELNTYGIQGRIPPYLLKPVKSTTSIQGMFKNCKQISYYNYEGYNYIIPKTFFKYAPNLDNLSQAFYGMMFPYKIDLNVFDQYLKLNLNIKEIFMYSNFLHEKNTNEKSLISGIFKNLFINNLTRAFCVNTPDSSTPLTQNNIIRKQYVIFDDIFNKDKHIKNTAYQVFDGYNSDTVEFRTKTVSEESNKYNYRTSN